MAFYSKKCSFLLEDFSDRFINTCVDFETLYDQLIKSKNTKILICGSAGIGKTTYASQFTRYFYEKDPTKNICRSFNMNSKDTIENNFFHGLFNEFQLDRKELAANAKQPHLNLKKIFNKIDSNLAVLFVFDNIDDQDESFDIIKLIMKQLPENVSVLATSAISDTNFKKYFDVNYDIKAFNLEQSKQYIERSLRTSIQQNDLSYLIKLFEDDSEIVPLKLNLIHSYLMLNQNDLTFRESIDKIKENNFANLNKYLFRKLFSEQNADFKTILILIAHMDSKHIGEYLLLQLLPEVDKQKLKACLKNLNKNYLVLYLSDQADELVYNIHDDLQQSLRLYIHENNLGDAVMQDFYAQIYKLLTNNSKFSLNEINQILKVLSYGYKSSFQANQAYFLIILVLDSHFKMEKKIELAEKVLRFLSEENFAFKELSQSNAKAMLLDFLAKSYFAIDDFNKSAKNYLKYLKIIDNKNSEKISSVCYSIGNCYQKLSDYRTAVNYYERVWLNIKESNNFPINLIIEILIKIAMCFSELKEYEKSIDYFEKVFKLAINNPNISKEIYSEMAFCYEKMKLYEKSIEFYIKTYQICKNEANQEYTAQVLENIGVCYSKLNNHEKSTEYYEKSLKLKHEIGNDQGIQATLNKIGQTKIDTCQYSKSLEIYENMLETTSETKNLPRILNNIGLCHFHLTDYSKAIEFHQRAISILIDEQENVEMAIALESIAKNLRELGDHQELIEYYEKALSIRQKLNQNSSAIPSLIGLGNAYIVLGDFKKSIQFYEQSLAISKQENLNEDVDSDTAGVLSNLGQSYLNLGDFNKSLEFYEKALKMVYKLHGDKDHINVGLVLSGIGSCHLRLGRSRQSIEYNTKALKMFNKIHLNEPMNSYIFGTLNSLGCGHFNLAEYDKSIEYHEKALKAAYSLFGTKEHPEVAKILSNLAGAYTTISKYQISIRYSEQALDMFNKLTEDKNHKNFALIKNNLGVCYLNLAKYDRAIENFQSSLSIIESTDHQTLEIASVLNNIGLCYFYLHKYYHAIEAHEKSLKIKRNLFGDKAHPEISSSLNNLGLCFKDLKQYEKAVEFYEQSLKMKYEMYPNRVHRSISQSLNNIGTCYSMQGKYMKAIEYYEKSLKMFYELYENKDNGDVALTLHNIGNCFKLLKNYAKAQEYFEKSLEIKRRIYPDHNHPEVLMTLRSMGFE